MQEQFHLTIRRDAPDDRGNRHHTTQHGPEIRHRIVCSGPMALPHLRDDLAIGQGLRQPVQDATSFRIRDPFCVEGPYLVRHGFEHHPSLTAGLGVHRRVGASACIQRSSGRLPPWSYNTSSYGACRVPRRSSSWCLPRSSSASASARDGLALLRTRREERPLAGACAHPPGCSGGALPRTLWHHSV